MIAEQKWIVEDATMSGPYWVFTIVDDTVALVQFDGSFYPNLIISFGCLEA